MLLRDKLVQVYGCSRDGFQLVQVSRDMIDDCENPSGSVLLCWQISKAKPGVRIVIARINLFKICRQ